MDLSRREFSLLAVTSLTGSNVSPQLDQQSQPNQQYDFQGVAHLIGPANARPTQPDPFFDNKIVYAYLYRTNAGDLWFTTDDMSSWQRSIQTAISFKAHRVDTLTSPTLNSWTTLGGFVEQTDESPNEFVTLNADGKTLDFNYAGLYRFNGCFKIQNNTTGQTTARVLLRLYANGTTELRCSQRQWLETINADSQITFPYGGTDTLTDGDTIQLQYWTDNDSIDFKADSRFDSPVTATISCDYLGPLP